MVVPDLPGGEVHRESGQPLPDFAVHDDQSARRAAAQLSDAGCDLWVSALRKIFDGHLEMVWYFQRLCGYCLTGDVREQILPVFGARAATARASSSG